MDDNEADVFLIEEAIAATELKVVLHVARDGAQAVRFLDDADSDDEAPCPALVILDINLPKKPGREVLNHLRKGRRCGKAAVIVVSTSNSLDDQQQMMELGASAYFRKPSEFDEFVKLSDLIKSVLGRS